MENQEMDDHYASKRMMMLLVLNAASSIPDYVCDTYYDPPHIIDIRYFQ